MPGGGWKRIIGGEAMDGVSVTRRESRKRRRRC